MSTKQSLIRQILEPFVTENPLERGRFTESEIGEMVADSLANTFHMVLHDELELDWRTITLYLAAHYATADNTDDSVAIRWVEVNEGEDPATVEELHMARATEKCKQYSEIRACIDAVEKAPSLDVIDAQLVRLGDLLSRHYNLEIDRFLFELRTHFNEYQRRHEASGDELSDRLHDVQDRVAESYREHFGLPKPPAEKEQEGKVLPFNPKRRK